MTPIPNTSGVTVVFGLDSCDAAPPYEITTCTTTVNADGGGSETFQGWGGVNFGTPDANGATFAVNVVDANYANDATTVANWALTCIPRTGTTWDSPFSNNQDVTPVSARNIPTTPCRL